MSLVREIATWADSQAEWMSDAVRRLVAQGTLTNADFVDIAALMKTSVGINDPQQRKAVRVQIDALPDASAPGLDVSITALRKPKHLNAIGFEAGLTFAPTGLTVVYGYNGSGKSGYVRALKKACRARNTEDIIPNVFAPPNPPQPAQARFEWVAAGVPDAADWKDGGPSPAPLSRVAIFDSYCARVFIDEQAAVSYLPYGMDVLSGLSACMDKAQKLLEHERDAARFDRTLLATLSSGETDVARLVTAVSRKTDPKQVEKLAKLPDDEQAELAELNRALTDNDSHRRAQALRRLAARVVSLEQELTKLVTPLSDEHMEQLRSSFVQLKSAHGAVEIAAAAMNEGTLPGTGTEPWVQLLRSAAEFAAYAYAGHEFPGPTEASCVLCQQPLTADARKRLEQFWSFVRADAQQRHDTLRDKSKELYVPVKDAAVTAFPSDRTVLEELAERGSGTVEAVKAYVTALASRQEAVKQMAAKRQLDVLPALPADPRDILLAINEDLVQQAVKIEAGMTAEQRETKQRRLAQLLARVKLGEHLPTVLQAIEADKNDFLFAEALKCCQTRALTQKSGELYQKSVTQDLQAALAREQKTIGVDGIQVTFGLSGQKGTRMQQLKLSAAAAIPKTPRLSGILSEGEQRAIAIASFLAEVSLEPGNSAIVFDDPVNSLDHRRRERIAKRLAMEAKQRQVIVFTHDLAFAWELQDSAKAQGQKAAVRHVFAAGSSKGHCSEKLPFEGQKLDARINVLKEVQARAKKAIEVEQDYDKYNSLMRDGYMKLRTTWEQLVEDHLFAGTVKRFQRAIKTQSLRSVTVEDLHAKAVYDGMTRASYFAAHDGGTEAPPALPEPHEFLQDILELESTAKAITQSKSEAEARREKLGIPRN
jgi:ABC-type cobalamin transport system ATPase subunit